MNETLESRLRRHVYALAEFIGERNVFMPGSLQQAADYIRGVWRTSQLTVSAQAYEARGVASENLWVDIRGAELPEEILVVSAHYDSIKKSPGADDDASGVAAILEMARTLRDLPPPRRTVRLVAFTNEEPPFFFTPNMGSRFYVRNEVAKKKEKIWGCVALDMVGYYSDKPRSQKYPFPFLNRILPHRGNFLTIVGDIGSRKFIKRFAHHFKATGFPSHTLVAPRFVPGIDWADHRAFLDYGAPGLVLTDTAGYRYAHYHKPKDRADQLAYPAFARAVQALIETVRHLADE